MGRKNRERIARIEVGLEEPISPRFKVALYNPIARQAVAISSRGAVVKELSQGSTTDQVNRLDDLVGTGNLPARRLKEALMKKAPKEMDKAIRDFRKKGKEISVDNLCAEAESTPSFVKMCENVGLPMSWFRELAKERMEANSV